MTMLENVRSFITIHMIIINIICITYCLLCDSYDGNIVMVLGIDGAIMAVINIGLDILINRMR